jgi:predicted amidophosphoribosyltransferase
MGIYFPNQKTPIKEDVLSQHVVWLKSNSAEWATPIGEAMFVVLRKLYPELMDYDILVPIPHFEALAHTYDHAEELAKTLSKNLKKPWKQMVAKTRSERLVGKPLEDRWSLSRNLFAPAADSSASGKSILLIDDVCTTGCSLSRCATILAEECQAEKVAAFVAGRDYDRDYPIS